MALYQGTTFQGAEEHRRVEVMSQGTTLVVPGGPQESRKWFCTTARLSGVLKNTAELKS
jgi:hypothetical protein